ncbi:MAG: RNA-binding cell elongation regulator Jag/EloR [Lachnospiraceae bacterium]
MDMITISAKTLDEAITKALIELQTTSDHLYYEVTEKGSPGLLGIFGVKPCVIRARVKSEEEEQAEKRAEQEKADLAKEEARKEEIKKAEARKAAEAKKAEAKKAEQSKKEVQKHEKVADKPSEKTEKAAKPAKTVAKVDEAAVQAKAKEFLNQIFASMGMQVTIDTQFNTSEGELQISMSGDDMGILIGKRGQTLDSMQYLVSLVVNKETEGYVRVKLDTENYRERRKETLETLAKNISYKVKRTKRSVSLEPMNPYERRIIHATLQGDRYVVTRSEGEDPYRHVVVSLKREGYNGKKDRYQSRPKEKPEVETEIKKEV